MKNDVYEKPAATPPDESRASWSTHVGEPAGQQATDLSTPGLIICQSAREAHPIGHLLNVGAKVDESCCRLAGFGGWTDYQRTILHSEVSSTVLLFM